MAINSGDLILALDLGTSSSRAILYDAQTAAPFPGGMQAAKHAASVTEDGGATLDANALVNEIAACMESVLARTNGRRVVGVAVCTFWHSFVGVDKNGIAKTPIYLWNDHRADKQAAHLRRVLDADYTQRTGCLIHTSYPPARLLWLKETNPEVFAACDKFVSPGEFLMAQLFGRENVSVSFSMASGTGLLNQAQGVWDEETLSHLPGLGREKLSPLSDAPVSAPLCEPYKSRFPALSGAAWFPALGDGACSNIGCGSLRPDTIALMIGTSGALRVATPLLDADTSPPPVPPGLWRYLIEPNRYLLGGALSNGGSVWAWCKKTFNLPKDDDALETLLAALPPDSHGLTILPFLAGERAPLWRDDLRGIIDGLGSATTPEQIVRAHLEAVALRFAALRVSLFPVAPHEGSRVIGTGGGLNASPLWAQIIADALGESILLSGEAEASSRGAVLWAREKLGGGSMETAPPVGIVQTLMPRPDFTDVYARARARQDALLARILPAASSG